MARILTSLILLAAYFLAMGQSEAAQCLGSAATVEITHSHEHGHGHGHEPHHESHASEAPAGQDQQPHSHEIVVAGCACFVVPSLSMRLFEAPSAGTTPPVSEHSSAYVAKPRSIFRPPIA